MGAFVRLDTVPLTRYMKQAGLRCYVGWSDARDGDQLTCTTESSCGEARHEAGGLHIRAVQLIPSSRPSVRADEQLPPMLL